MSTKESLQAANTLLAALTANATYTPTQMLDQLYLVDDPAKMKASDALHKYMQKNATAIPPGMTPKAIAGSTQALCAKYLPNMLPSTTAIAMAELKSAKRVTQIGGGKGKALVILNNLPIPIPAELTAAIVQESITDALKSLKHIVMAMDVDYKAMEAKVTSLETAVAEKDKIIDNLSQQIKAHHQTTWS